MTSRDIIMSAAGAATPAVWKTALSPRYAGMSNGAGIYVSSIQKFVWSVGTNLYATATADYQTFTTLSTTGITQQITSIAYSSSLNLYVGVGSTGVIQTSPDILTWTSRTSGTANTLNKIVWNGSIFVAVGASGTILTSTDGITWTSRTSGTATSLTGIAWDGSKFLAINTTQYITSPDGITWAAAATLTGITGATKVDWNGTLFVVVGASGVIITSPNGTTWTSRTTGASSSFNNVASNGSTVLAVAGSGQVSSSTDSGVTWTYRSVGALLNYLVCAWSNDRFVLYGSTQNLYYSYDAITFYIGGMFGNSWQSLNGGYNPSNGTFGIGGNGFAASSSNKINWKPRGGIGSTAQGVQSITYVSALGLWIATTNGGLIYYSSDFISWTGISSYAGATRLTGVAWNGTLLVASYRSSGFITSTTGTSWTYAANSATRDYPIWAGTQFVVIGSTPGNILTSPDGTTWTTRTSVYTGLFNMITWTGSLIVGVGNTGTVATSPDGITWTARTTGLSATADYFSTDASGSTVWAVGQDGTNNGVVYYSLDGGITWTNDTTIPADATIYVMYGVKCGSGTDVVVWGKNNVAGVPSYLMYR